MSGQDVPYHLRPNKLVDRRLFLDALAAFERCVPGPRAYASMGGRNLEDHREVHVRLGIDVLVSIESDHVTHARQLFNKPLHLIECRHETAGDFVTDFDAFQQRNLGRRAFVWLDYADPKQRYEQLSQAYSLFERMERGDVLRVTLNASLDTLGGRKEGQRETADQLRDRRLQKLKSQIGEYAPRPATDDDLTPNGLPVFLVGCVERAATKGLAAAGLVPLPLVLTRYSDGPHQMVTAAVAIVNDHEAAALAQELATLLPEFTNSWANVNHIAIPDLTLRERLRLDACLHQAPDRTLVHMLGFPLDGDAERGAELIGQYRRHYRRLGTFARLDGILG